MAAVAGLVVWAVFDVLSAVADAESAEGFAASAGDLDEAAAAGSACEADAAGGGLVNDFSDDSAAVLAAFLALATCDGAPAGWADSGEAADAAGGAAKPLSAEVTSGRTGLVSPAMVGLDSPCVGVAAAGLFGFAFAAGVCATVVLRRPASSQ
jgi:hypothetical protein